VHARHAQLDELHEHLGGLEAHALCEGLEGDLLLDLDDLLVSGHLLRRGRCGPAGRVLLVMTTASHASRATAVMTPAGTTHARTMGATHAGTRIVLNATLPAASRRLRHGNTRTSRPGLDAGARRRRRTRRSLRLRA